MRPRLFIYMHYMELGGAERALLGLLNAVDCERVDVDLFLNQHTGAFMSLIPSKVHLLSERKGYNAIERPLIQVLKEGQFKIALARIKARREHDKYYSTLDEHVMAQDSSIFQYVMDAVAPHLDNLDDLGEYDLAISFMQPHNIVLDKVRAKKKICWIHTDYSTIHVHAQQELKIWEQYDHVVSISEDCTRAFLKTFPSLSSKIILMENILSSDFVREQARLGAAHELQVPHGVLKLVSVGRISYAKNYDNVPHIARLLKAQGLKFKWFIVGPGDHRAIDKTIIETGTGDVVEFLGSRNNPYPYIKEADIYVQLSRYEGKSVTVREAQMLCRPVLITNYATASSQVSDGKDGIICPMDNEGIAQAIWELAHDDEKREKLSSYCREHDFGNEKEINKIYQLVESTGL